MGMSGMQGLGQSIEKATERRGEAETLDQMIMRQADQIKRALPAAANMTPEKLARVALTIIKADSRPGGLSSCTPRSMLAALMVAAQLGLEPGPLGHVYFSPRFNGRLKVNEVQITLGYKGIIELARRGGVKIEARDVREGDEFSAEYGLEPKLVHKPRFAFDAEPSPVVGWYMVARFPDGSTFFHVMTKHEVERHRMRSDAGRKGEGPWATDYDSMARKTVIRAAQPYLPLMTDTAEALARAFNADETVRSTFDPDELDVPRPIETTAIEAADGDQAADTGASGGTPAESEASGDDAGPDRPDAGTAGPDRTEGGGGPAVGEAAERVGGDDVSVVEPAAGPVSWLDTIDGMPDDPDTVAAFVADRKIPELRAIAREFGLEPPRTLAPKSLAPIVTAILERKGMAT